MKKERLDESMLRSFFLVIPAAAGGFQSALEAAIFTRLN